MFPCGFLLLLFFFLDFKVSIFLKVSVPGFLSHSDRKLSKPFSRFQLGNVLLIKKYIILL